MLMLLQLLAACGLIIGCFILFKISLFEFTDSIFKNLLDKPKSIKDQINEATNRKKPIFIKRELLEVKEILKMTGRTDKFSIICILSFLCFVAGVLIAILMDNVFLILPLAGGMMIIPLWYVKLTATYYKKDIAAELETALSIITTAYLRNEDIVTAVEENLEYLNSPIKEFFGEFLMQLKLINADIVKAIQILKTKVENEVFREWCDGLCACQFDRNLKSTLTPIVTKLSDIRIVNSELDLLVFEPRKEFIIMVFLAVGNIPLMRFLNKAWYDILMFSIVGRVILAVTALAIFISTSFVLKLTKPIEFRR